jgi:hypothetical protein
MYSFSVRLHLEDAMFSIAHARSDQGFNETSMGDYTNVTLRSSSQPILKRGRAFKNKLPWFFPILFDVQFTLRKNSKILHFLQGEARAGIPPHLQVSIQLTVTTSGWSGNKDQSI